MNLGWLLLIIFIIAPFLIAYLLFFRIQYKILSEKMEELDKEPEDQRNVDNDN